MYKVFFWSLFLIHFLGQAQSGCTDPQASNYNSAAIYNNGTCVYDATSYSLTNPQPLPSQLNEISGMVFYNGFLYGHQDSGGAAALYEIDPSTVSITKTINLLGVTNIDWEDIAQDETHFYLCDTGNNASGNRTDLKIYKFAKNLITAGAIINIPFSAIETIQYNYEDQTDFSAQSPNTTAFDCEAVAFNRGKLHLFTKNWSGNTTSHYVLPITAGIHTAKKIETYNTGSYRITGADFGAYDVLILIGYQTTGFANCALFLDYGFDGTYYYLGTGAVRRLDIGTALTLGQVEAICFENPLKGYIANESFTNFISVPQRLYEFNISSFLQDYYAHNTTLESSGATIKAGTIRFDLRTNAVQGYDGTHWLPFH